MLNRKSCATVPFTPFEWTKARSLFNRTNLTEVMECVSMLTMWTNRMGDNTPVAIQCSRILLQARLSELRVQTVCESEKWLVIDELKSKHGHAITRFVNYVNEMGQTKKTYLINMATSVQEYGIPKWIVDVRHQITHLTMPDLDILRSASNFCLEWLWKEFWLKEAPLEMIRKNAINEEESVEFQSTTQREQEYLKCIRKYSEWRNKNRHFQNATKEHINELMIVHQNLIKDPECFLRAFTADGVLIMTPNQLKSMNIVTTKEDKTIDSKIQIFWEPIFRIIFDVKLGTEFVIALLWRLKDNEIIDSSSHQVLLYCRELIEHFIDSDHVAEKDWIRILDCLLSVASYFEPKLIESIMASIPKMSRKRRDQVRRIIKIQTTTKTIENDSSDIRTVEDLQKLLKKDRIATDKNEVLKDEAQSAALIEICDQEEDWSDIPFGLAPDQRIEVFSLVLDKEYLGQSLRNNSKKHKLEN